MLSFLFVFGTLLAATRGQDCVWVNRLDCNTYGSKPLCGSNYVTYTNRCTFAKFHCTNPSVNILSETTCEKAGFTSRPLPTTKMATTAAATKATTQQATAQPTPAPTTPGPTVPTVPTTTHKPVFQGHDLVFDFFCLELAHNPCPNDTERVCGSDLKIYDSFLELAHNPCPNDTKRVCGSDLKIYDSFCEFEKQRCSHQYSNLTVLHFIAC